MWIQADDGTWINGEQLAVLQIQEHTTREFRVQAYVAGTGVTFTLSTSPTPEAAREYLQELIAELEYDEDEDDADDDAAEPE